MSSDVSDAMPMELVMSAMRTARRSGRGPAGAAPDAAFTLIEVVVAMALVAVVAMSGTLFELSSLRVVRQQANEQVATQMMAAALDQARVAGGAALLASPPAQVTTQVDGVSFVQKFTVTQCWQVTPGGACTGAGPAPGTAELVQVAVSVQWSDSGQVLTRRTDALLSSASVDPMFPS